MLLSRLALGSVALVSLVSCNGGESNPAPSPDPFIEFRVNRALFPTEVTVKRQHLVGEDQYNPCDPAIYANAAEVQAAAPDFCVTEATTASVVFSVQFFNAGYEDLNLTYTGQGYTVHVYKYDPGAVDFIGEEVWNSNYYAQYEIEAFNDVGYELDTFDPDQVTTIKLGPGVSFPHQNNGASELDFKGSRNFEPGYEVFDPNNFLLAKVPADSGSTELCNWGPTTSPTNALMVEKVICQFENLFPLPSADTGEEIKYVARVRFNFNNWQDQPEDVIITFTAP